MEQDDLLEDKDTDFKKSLAVSLWFMPSSYWTVGSFAKQDLPAISSELELKCIGCIGHKQISTDSPRQRLPFNSKYPVQPVGIQFFACFCKLLEYGSPQKGFANKRYIASSRGMQVKHQQQWLQSHTT